MKIKWVIRETWAAMCVTSYVDDNLIATVSFRTPEFIIWGAGRNDSKKVAEKISKRIKVKRVV